MIYFGGLSLIVHILIILFFKVKKASRFMMKNNIFNSRNIYG